MSQTTTWKILSKTPKFTAIFNLIDYIYKYQIARNTILMGNWNWQKCVIDKHPRRCQAFSIWLNWKRIAWGFVKSISSRFLTQCSACYLTAFAFLYVNTSGLHASPSHKYEYKHKYKTILRLLTLAHCISVHLPSSV